MEQLACLLRFGLTKLVSQERYLLALYGIKYNDSISEIFNDLKSRWGANGAAGSAAINYSEPIEATPWKRMCGPVIRYNTSDTPPEPWKPQLDVPLYITSHLMIIPAAVMYYTGHSIIDGDG